MDNIKFDCICLWLGFRIVFMWDCLQPILGVRYRKSKFVQKEECDELKARNLSPWSAGN